VPPQKLLASDDKSSRDRGVVAQCPGFLMGLPSEGTVSNVFQLFKQTKNKEPSDPKTILTVAVANILASKFELDRTVKELSKHLSTTPSMKLATATPGTCLSK
jgi:hypothetical protein